MIIMIAKTHPCRVVLWPAAAHLARLGPHERGAGAASLACEAGDERYLHIGNHSIAACG